MGIRASVYGRAKHIYSIYNKIREQKIDFAQVADLVALRVVVDTVADCWAALGLVHSLWMPLRGMFSDYISKPKPNGYQSLHTKVMGPGGQIMEVQIRTAPPIRQAMVRMMQIAQNYDQLPDEQKKQFDQQTQGFLAADTSEMIIVHMSYSTNFPQNYRDLAQHWQSQTAELLKNSVYLSGNKSDKVAIAQYIPGQEGQSEFQFIFPRKVDGKDIVGDQDKNLRLEFAYPVVGRIGDGRGFLEFKLDKMMFNGNIVY